MIAPRPRRSGAWHLAFRTVDSRAPDLRVEIALVVVYSRSIADWFWTETNSTRCLEQLTTQFACHHTRLDVLPALGSAPHTHAQIHMTMSLLSTSYAAPPLPASLAPSRELLCGYRSKVCANVRATKLDGSLHKLCEFHRLKANSSQRRLQKRRQLRKLQEAATSSGDDAPTSPPAAKRARTAKSASPTTSDDAALLYAPVTGPATEFNASDVALLEQTLFSSASMLPPLYDAPVPAPLGVFDMDAVVSDVLREFSGPVTMPKVDAASGWYWTV